MTKIAIPLTLLVTALVCLPPLAPAQALSARTFVSAAGSDSNNCSNAATPCRHLAAAYAATALAGEIYVLDPANYGSLTITGSVSIEGHGWASIAPIASQAAITINANAGDKINIIGVVLDGTAIANTTGIAFNARGNLTVRDSVIRNFTNAGISFGPLSPSALAVSNTLVSDNNLGISIVPGGTGSAAGVLDHVNLEDNSGAGLTVSAGSGQTVTMTVSDSMIANNAGNGIEAISVGGTPKIMVRNSTIANNGLAGVFAQAPPAVILISRSTITGSTGAWNGSGGGTITSYSDNNIDGNVSGNTAPPNPFIYK